MSETIAGRKVFSLREVGLSIQRTLKERYSSSFWVKAELHKLNHYSHTGHCYPELLEKSEGKIIAQFRSVMWKSDVERIQAAFLKTLREPLRDGITILFEASIQYDPVYDLSLRILDIDPSYSLGELEKERLETIARLKKEGIFAQNKNCLFPDIPKRLAIISVESSKGYADFLKVIDQNPWGYKYVHVLLPALLQGERAVASIVAALRRVQAMKQHFDLVLIIRGGGGDIGLSCYNHYDLCREIALFPLPVLTGVGHATNETVAELVSFRHFITPTEAATYLIQAYHNQSVPLKKAEEALMLIARSRLQKEKDLVVNLSRYFVLSVRRSLQGQNQYLEQGPQRILTATRSARRFLQQQLDVSLSRLRTAAQMLFYSGNQQIQSFEKQKNLLDPDAILKRGFSITVQNGKVLSDARQVNVGASMETILYQGKVVSNVVSKTNEQKDE